MIVIDPRRTETADAGRLPPAGPARDRRLVPRRAGRRPRAGGPASHRAGSTEHAAGRRRGRRRARAPSTSPRMCAIAGVDEDLRPRGRPPHRRRGERRRVRGPRRADVAALHPVELPREAGLAADRQPRHARAPSTCPPRLVALAGGGRPAGRGRRGASPVVGARIISGLVPCNVIADEILTDHPARYRAMLVESANPAHSLADSRRMREALEALDLLVVIDVALTETARLADYVLPASSQFEKWEATFFNFEFPRNVFHLRRPVLDPLPGTLPEPEIHARLVEALGALRRRRPRAAAGRGRGGAGRLRRGLLRRPRGQARAGPLRARSCSTARSARPCPTAPRPRPPLWGAAHRCALENPASVAAAGFDGEGLEPGEALFDAILASPSGVVFTVDEPRRDLAPGRDRRRPGRSSPIPELLDELAGLADRRAAGTDRRLPVRPVGRRAPLVHRQHHHPRPRLAEARRDRARCGSAPATPTRLGSATATWSGSRPSEAAVVAPSRSPT